MKKQEFKKFWKKIHWFQHLFLFVVFFKSKKQISFCLKLSNILMHLFLSKYLIPTTNQADDPPVSFWCAFRIFSLCLFDRSYQMLTETATFSITLGKCLLKVITLMLNTATGLWQSQQTETGLWCRTMFCNVLPFFDTSNKGKTLPCANT